MRRVIVESPFAPRTPLPADECANVLMCNGDCAYCSALNQRERESDLHGRYLDACLLDCLRRGESPFASHGLYTRPGVLDDMKPHERAYGISAGFAWRRAADATVFYTDLGWSSGMKTGEVDAVLVIGQDGPHVIEYRTLGADWERR